jgi:hypothetical protein
MKRERERERLILADRHIAEAKNSIARQRQLRASARSSSPATIPAVSIVIEGVVATGFCAAIMSPHLPARILSYRPGGDICGHRERGHRRGAGRTLHFDRSDRCGTRGPIAGAGLPGLEHVLAE